MGITSIVRRLKLLIAGALALFILAAFVHPFGEVKHVSSRAPLLAGAEVDSHTRALFERSCQNCHSDRTAWPWYSYLPPASWMLERDVHQARLHMNLSHWSAYTPEERQAILGIMAAAVRNKQMPPARYTLLHAEAVLSGFEREEIYRWARGERRRLFHASGFTQSH